FALLVNASEVRHLYRDAWTIWELLAPVDELSYLTLQLSTSLVVLGLVLGQQRRVASRAQLLTFVLAAWASCQLVFRPATERRALGLVAPLTGWSVVCSVATRRGTGLSLIAYFLTFIGSIGQIERAIMPHFPAIIVLHPVGVLCFAVWLIGYARTRPSAVE